MKLYHDENKAFYYIEKDGVWFESLYEEESEWKEVPPIKHIEHAGLIEDDINDLEYPEWLTNCDDCNNKGYYYDDLDNEYYVCVCYHGQTHGKEDIFNAETNDKEDYYDESDYQEWKRGER